ncbi:TRAP transporter substrate-binding protein DctP [Maribacter sp. LLG6340-A2]|uniref:TRAP transporter substrate-binding protein DctP n=1 Tax=Maribacter sp. LLG6340-A2 TaxID=3160834 RepID=UPI00386809C4
MKIKNDFIRIYYLILICTTSILLSCGDKNSKNKNKNAPKLRFRLALELKPETKIWEVSNLFQTELEKASDKFDIKEGEIKVDFYDQGAIGTERQLLEACNFGVIEMVQVNSAVVTSIEPAFAILNLPYLFKNEAHHQNVLNGNTGKEMLNLLEQHSLKGLGFYSAGFRSMFYKFPKEKPCIQKPDELNGLKIRVMESPTMIATINAMGASASPLPFSELYQGIKTGVVDGAENSAKVFTSYHYEEAGCNCYTLTEHSTDQHVLIANEDWLNSLEPKYRKRILEVSKDIIEPFNIIWKKTTEKALIQIENDAVRVNVIADKSDFVTSVQPVYNHFFQLYPNVSKSLFNQIKNSE